ncbi:DUF4917 family protein [Candidatus Desantisbacteria bacterium]|nr:DUF4917 family protein [Candidatus Desantisbacteria bacterium]
MELKDYKSVVNYLNSKKREKHLLLGNGFSMSYDRTIFSYNALSDFLNQSEDKLLKKLFSIINTRNFELIMKQLDVFYELAKEFSKDKNFAKNVIIARDSLKTKLIDAITTLHPEHVFKIPEEKSLKCADFLNEYLGSGGHVFSTNYDLLLYWVLMKNKERLTNIEDGFGRDLIEKDAFESDCQPEFGELEWGNNRNVQCVHYVHGALHLFDSGVAIRKETYDGEFLLENIKKRIEKKEYPIFVTAGDGKQKLDHILHNQYLDYCYKQLSSIQGSLITFGFNFGAYDKHIIDAINKAAKQDKSKRLWSIYIGVYSDEDKRHIESISSKFKCKVNLFDSKTVSIWE